MDSIKSEYSRPLDNTKARSTLYRGVFKMGKKIKVLAITSAYPIEPIYLSIGDTLEQYQEFYPSLLSEDTIKKASSRFGTKKKNLVLIELPRNQRTGRKAKNTILVETTRGTIKLVQEHAVLMDGASTPVRIGSIQNFGPEVNRAFYVHDAGYALVRDVVTRKQWDRVFAGIMNIDGVRKIAIGIMFVALRMFGKRAMKMEPRDHWNYNRVKIYHDDVRIDG